MAHVQIRGGVADWYWTADFWAALSRNKGSEDFMMKFGILAGFELKLKGEKKKNA